MVWSQQGMMNDLVYRGGGRRIPLPYYGDTPPPIVPLPNAPVAPGTMEPLNQFMMPMDSSVQGMQNDARQAFLERIGIPSNASNNRANPQFTDYLNRAEQIMFHANQVNHQAELLRLRRATQQFMPHLRGHTRTSVAFKSNGGGSNPRLSFIQAIARQESGGNYGARNKSSGALGKYQIMPANVPGWSREALGRSISAGQFYSSPQLQEKIARYKLSQYFRKYGAAGAASAWFSGRPDLYRSSSQVRNYVNSILRYMGRR